MAKDVESLDNAKVTLKKNATTKDSKATCEGKIITIKTDTKLTAGDYTITIAGLEVEDLTATVNVEKNEYLKSYKVDEHLIAGGTYVNTWGYVYYQALNQYDEPMNADKPTVTCSFATKTDVTRTASATQEGIIEIGHSAVTGEQIPATLAIAGTSGTIVLVDANNGVNNSANITWSTAATADKVEVAGMYSTSKSKFKDIVAKDNPQNYFYLIKITDQYGHSLNYKQVENDLQMNVAGGITKVELAGSTIDTYLKDFTIGSEDYLAVMFKSDSAKAGDATLTVVNNKKGLLLTQTITVADYVVITNFVATDENGIYAGKKNELGFEATDSEGNAVTSFAVLDNTVVLGDPNLYWEKKDDGSAKLIYDLSKETNGSLKITSNNSHTGNITKALTFYCNEPTSGKYLVKTNTYTVYQEREVKSVLGLKDGTTTQFSTTTGKLELPFNKIVLADQYANKITSDDGTLWSNAMKTLAKDAKGNVVSWAEGNTKDVVTTQGEDKFIFESRSASATTTLYFKNLCAINGGTGKEASADNYDYRLVITAVDTKKIDNESITLDNINKGYTVLATSSDGGKTYSASISETDLSVNGLVAGAKTEIPASQLKIQSVSNNSFSETEVKSGVKTKTASAIVQVTTFDASNNTIIKTLTRDFQVSYADRYAFELTGVAGDIVVDGNVITGLDIQKVLTFKDQYGKAYTNTTKQDGEKLTYKVVARNTTGVQVTGENVANITVTNLSNVENLELPLSVTINTPNGKKENKTITGCFKAPLSGYGIPVAKNVEIDNDVVTQTTSAIKDKLEAVGVYGKAGYNVTVSAITIKNNKIANGNTFTYKLEVSATASPKLVKTYNFTGTLTEKELANVTLGAITCSAMKVSGDASNITGSAFTTLNQATASYSQNLTVAGLPNHDDVAASCVITSNTSNSFIAGDKIQMTVTYNVPAGYTVTNNTAVATTNLEGSWKVISAKQTGDTADTKVLTVVLELTIEY
ncbi:MAG: hypothetical protein ACI4EE_07765 [Lachnospiraceae bacterium]